MNEFTRSREVTTRGDTVFAPATRSRFPRSSTAPNHGRTPEQLAYSVNRIVGILARRAENNLPLDKRRVNRRCYGDIAITLSQMDGADHYLEVMRRLPETRYGGMTDYMRWWASVEPGSRAKKRATLSVMGPQPDKPVDAALLCVQVSAGKTTGTLSRSDRVGDFTDNEPVAAGQCADHAAHILNKIRVGVNDAIATYDAEQQERVKKFIDGDLL